MVTRDQLKQDLAELLQTSVIQDYCPNGLQIEGKTEIKKIVTGVTASLALIEAAIAAHADALLVHHGYFWKSESAVITGAKRARIAKLLAHDMNLFAYHLPLDIHPELGNNVQLAQQLDITVTAAVSCDGISDLLLIGELAMAKGANEFAEQLERQLQHKPLFIKGGDHTITRLAWCTGAAQRYLETAYEYKVDAYMSGEVSETTYHFAVENNIHYYAAGHHATERYGVQALGEYLARTYQIEHQFIDISNPV